LVRDRGINYSRNAYSASKPWYIADMNEEETETGTEEGVSEEASEQELEEQFDDEDPPEDPPEDSSDDLTAMREENADLRAIIAGFSDSDVEEMLDSLAYRRDGTAVFDASKFAREPERPRAKRQPRRRPPAKVTPITKTPNVLELSEQDFNNQLAQAAGLE